MDFKQKAQDLFALAGGVENVSSVTHCSTRLRFFVINKQIVDTDKIKAQEGVLGVVFKNDELQMVFGKNVIPVYNEAVKLYNAGAGGTADPVNTDAPKEKKRLRDIGNAVIGFVSAAVTPLIPGLVAGGMLKVFLLLATLAFPAFKDAMAYTLLSQLADVPFYFMPIFVAYGAAKKLGSTPLVFYGGSGCIAASGIYQSADRIRDCHYNFRYSGHQCKL